MKLSELKTFLNEAKSVEFQLPNGEMVPNHFHVTEVGQINKRFIDCGGTLRNENVINFQLWTTTDYDHRLSAEKLRSIIELSEDKLDLEDNEIEVEYQGETIGKYGLESQNGVFQLTSTQTDCLAKDKCGVPQEKPRIRLSTLQNQDGCCTPGSGCC